MKQYKIALIGFGGVNRALAGLIASRNEVWASSLGFQLSVVAVTDLHLGSIVSPGGIVLAELLAKKFGKRGFADLAGGSAEADNERVIKASTADIVAEATYSNPVDGEPAITHCRWAIEAGKHVVTTNKGPVAFAARTLNEAAQRNNLAFEYEGSVMSGTPVIRLARSNLAGSEIEAFEGILNGTSNFVLGKMEDGLSFADSVRQAQAQGYAEANPAADVEGYDVRLKVVILANELLGANLHPDAVPCQGIAHLTAQEVREAISNGQRWKLIGSASRTPDGAVKASVSPQLLQSSHPLACIHGSTNAISIRSAVLGEVTVSGPGAGTTETAFALLSDIIAIHARLTLSAQKAGL